MAFQYYGANQPQTTNNPYLIERPQQQGGGMPFPGLQGFQQFMPAGQGATAGAGEAAGSAIGGAGAGGGSAAGSAAGGGSSAGGGFAAAGPWALLAAVIIANESEAQKAGRRDEDRTTRAQDMITGKVLEQDMDYYGDKVGGVGGEFLKGIGQLGNPEGVFNLLKRGSLLRKVFD